MIKGITHRSCWWSVCNPT